MKKALLVFLSLAASAGGASDCFWTGGDVTDGTRLDLPANWTNSIVPTAADNVTFSTSATSPFSLTLPGSTSVAQYLSATVNAGETPVLFDLKGGTLLLTNETDTAYGTMTAAGSSVTFSNGIYEALCNFKGITGTVTIDKDATFDRKTTSFPSLSSAARMVIRGRFDMTPTWNSSPALGENGASLLIDGGYLRLPGMSLQGGRSGQTIEVVNGGEIRLQGDRQLDKCVFIAQDNLNSTACDHRIVVRDGGTMRVSVQYGCNILGSRNAVAVTNATWLGSCKIVNNTTKKLYSRDNVITAHDHARIEGISMGGISNRLVATKHSCVAFSTSGNGESVSLLDSVSTNSSSVVSWAGTNCRVRFERSEFYQPKGSPGSMYIGGTSNEVVFADGSSCYVGTKNYYTPNSIGGTHARLVFDDSTATFCYVKFAATANACPIVELRGRETSVTFCPDANNYISPSVFGHAETDDDHAPEFRFIVPETAFDATPLVVKYQATVFDGPMKFSVDAKTHYRRTFARHERIALLAGAADKTFLAADAEALAEKVAELNALADLQPKGSKLVVDGTTLYLELPKPGLCVIVR